MILCPICESDVKIKTLSCHGCETDFHGDFEMPRLARLEPNLQKLAEHFILCGGNLKTMAKRLDVSYPTLRKRVDDLMAALEELHKQDEQKIDDILTGMEGGNVKYEKGLKTIKEMNGEL